MVERVSEQRPYKHVCHTIIAGSSSCRPWRRGGRARKLGWSKQVRGSKQDDHRFPDGVRGYSDDDGAWANRRRGAGRTKVGLRANKIEFIPDLPSDSGG